MSVRRYTVLLMSAAAVVWAALLIHSYNQATGKQATRSQKVQTLQAEFAELERKTGQVRTLCESLHRARQWDAFFGAVRAHRKELDRSFFETATKPVDWPLTRAAWSATPVDLSPAVWSATNASVDPCLMTPVTPPTLTTTVSLAVSVAAPDTSAWKTKATALQSLYERLFGPVTATLPSNLETAPPGPLQSTANITLNTGANPSVTINFDAFPASSSPSPVPDGTKPEGSMDQLQGSLAQ